MIVSLLSKEPSQAIYDEFDHYMDEPTLEMRDLDAVLEDGRPLSGDATEYATSTRPRAARADSVEEALAKGAEDEETLV